MVTVGVRELKSKLSHYLRLVREGGAVIITDRGRVVAELRAAPERTPEAALFELASRGVVRWSGGTPSSDFPLWRISGKPLSEIILEERGDPLP